MDRQGSLLERADQPAFSLRNVALLRGDVDGGAWRLSRSLARMTTAAVRTTMFNPLSRSSRSATGNNPLFKTKPVRPNRSVRTGIGLTFLCSPILLLSCSLALLAHSSPTLHAGPTPLRFHHSPPPPPPIAMTESLTSGRVLARARARSTRAGSAFAEPTRRELPSYSFLSFFLSFARPCRFWGHGSAL